jgi:hypothetical protein
MDKSKQLSKTVSEYPDEQFQGPDIKGAAFGVIALLATIFGIVILATLFVWASPAIRAQAPALMTVLIWGSIGLGALLFVGQQAGKHYRMVKEENRKDRRFRPNPNGGYDALLKKDETGFLEPTPGTPVQVTPHTMSGMDAGQAAHLLTAMMRFAKVNVTEEKPALLNPPKNTIVPDFPERRVTFAEVLERFTPTKERIFLLDTTGGDITGPVTGVTHIAQVGPTGGGKTICTRMLTSQIQYIGAKVYLASPNFAQVKLNNNYLEDWRPIVQHLAEPPAQSDVEINSLLTRFKMLFEKRKTKEQSTPRRGADLFLVLGEWPGIVDRCPDAPEIVKLLLREARQYGIHLIFEFQDALVKTIGVSSGARENIRHAYYYGGDLNTAKFALNLPNGIKLDETGLGKNGGAFMRSLVNDEVVSGRVPLFNNEALYMLLGAPPDPMPDYPIVDEGQIPASYWKVENGRYVDAGGSVTVDASAGRMLGESGRAGMEPGEDDFEARLQQWKMGGNRTGMQRNTGALENGVDQPLETLGESPNTRLGEYPLMDEQQVQRFIALYPLMGTDKALDEIPGCAHKHREHAREIIRQFNLQRKRG